MLNVTMIQTSDAIFYLPILSETSKTVSAYCQNNGLRYESFVGLKRGTMPWHSAYNRVYMLKEMLDRRVEGWVVYLDADAMIIDHDFDLRAFLRENDGYGAIFAGYVEPDRKYTINSGGFAVNLSHPVGISLVMDYWRRIEQIAGRDFNASLKWGKDIPDDQGILYEILYRYVEVAGFDQYLLFEYANSSHVNNGPFIRQALRSKSQSFSSRKALIKEVVSTSYRGGSPATWDPIDPGFYIEAAHPRLITSSGIKTLGSITSDGKAGCLLYGPYATLDAGHWTIRIFGSVDPSADGTPGRFQSDVVAGYGTQLLSHKEITASERVTGIIAVHEIEIADVSESVEYRIFVDEGARVSIFAVHIANTDEWVDQHV